MDGRRIAYALSVVAGLVVLAIVAAAAFTVWSVRRPYPDYGGTVEVSRLQGEVEIIRDEHGIPHVYADTAEDLFRAQGYVHAQDRFWEMDVRRHIGAGRLSELFGETSIEADAFLRTLGWRDIARQEFPLLAPSTRRYLQAYADGVNAWLAGRSGGELGLAYTVIGLNGADTAPRRWTAIDSLTWLKVMAWDLRSNMEDEISRAITAGSIPPERVEQLYPDFPYGERPPIVADEYLPSEPFPELVGTNGEPADNGALDALMTAADAIATVPSAIGTGEGVGSNSWVVAGSRTVTGAPMLVNDPHLGPAMPSVWYQIGLHCRTVTEACPFDVTGFSFSSLPGVIIGHNDRIAWGLTNLAPDVIDLYLEQVEGDLYRVGDDWMPMETRRETIRVAGGGDVAITVRTTRHGPLLSDHSSELREVGANAPNDAQADPPAPADGYAVALRWTALEPGRSADAVFMVNAARDWDSFREAAAMFEAPAQNLVYADVDGNIGYQAPGRIPVRDSGDGRWPVPGWTGENEWLGYVPFEALPSMFNPDEGYIVTANQPVTSPEYPFLLTADFDYGQRAARIHELLADAGPLDAEAMLAIQMDSRNPMAETLLPYLLALHDLGPYYREGMELLRDWDHNQGPDSAAAAYFNAVWRNLLRLTFHDELPESQWPAGGGRWFDVVATLLAEPRDPFWDDVDTAPVETRDDILRTAARDARDDLTRRQGKDPENWSWGRLHALTLREGTVGDSGIGLIEAMFNRGPVEVGGGSAILQANGWFAMDGYETGWVPSMRMVVDLGNLDDSRWIDLTGVSGHPFHTHYGDQTELWRTGQSLPMRSSQDAVRAAGVNTLLLVPPTDQ
ncbi:MAG TPA: penicillin acylase family protein [Jiangellaceae bacterium]